MEWSLGKYFIWVMIVLCKFVGSKGCFEKERVGLLAVKAFLKSHNERIDLLLSSWVDDGVISDCCGWERVKCSSTTGRVAELSLDAMIPFSRKGPEKIQFLNVSLFHPFEEVQSLDLSDNWFSGCVDNHGFENLSTMKKLEILNLGYNYFNNSILPAVGALTSLKTLNITSNRLGGSAPAKELATLRNLETLDISGNGYMTSTTMQDLERLLTLTELVTLNLGYNNLDSSILQSLSTFTSLKTLSLGGNGFGGSFPSHELVTLQNLEELDLSNSELDDAHVIQELTVLGNLKMLDLSLNKLNGSLVMQGSKRLSFKKLETLNLGYNSFDKNILQSLGALTSLKSLSLKYNRLQGSFPVQELAALNLKNLEMLDLSFNRLNDSLPMQELANMSNLKILNLRGNQFDGPLPIRGLTNFKNLEVLDLGANDFVGSIPPFIGNLTSLKALSLSKNKLNGSLTNQGLCELKNLQELDLSLNYFEGLLPPCLNSLRSLRLLDLSTNQLEGNISSSPIMSLTSLEYIDLSHNLFEGLFSFSSIANHSMLKVVIFTTDNNKLEVETEASSWVPKFQLTILALSNCNLNRLTNDIPNFLSNQYDLRVVDLSHNNLTRRFPNWLLENNTRLEFLNLRNNSFSGQFHLSLNSSLKIFRMDISDNLFHGQLQENIGEMLPTIFHLNISQNSFEGSIPPSIGNLTNLSYLDLSTNNFSGEVPEQLAIGCPNLLFLTLSNNRLQGQIFSLLFNTTNLMSLRLDNNQFTGNLSHGVPQWFLLRYLDISSNYMSGEIPSWIGNMTYLTSLNMRNNSFDGQIPCELVLVEFLDLSYNSLSGSLPSCLNFPFLKHIHLQGNKFTGSIPKTFLDSSLDLATMNINDNNLSGRIPNSIGALSNLRVLLLRGNYLSGLIPDQLCQLNKIGIMDLSRNTFSGSIPSCFNNISFGKIEENDLAFLPTLDLQLPRSTVYTFGGRLGKESNMHDTDDSYEEQVEVEIVTKSRLSIYKGGILDFMSGLDLSCNNLTGEIPHEIGHLSWIHALNLSHNQLRGSIPKTFSSLTQIESLDLSYNNLSGEIPSELTDLHFLEVFTVAHNNLSGRIPDVKQFGTFSMGSYKGNPFLCGSLLEKNCTNIVESPRLPTARPDETEGKWYELDRTVFFASFSVSYIVVLLGFAALLYVNPYWRRRWFNLIEECIYSCYYFVSDTLYKLSTHLYN